MKLKIPHFDAINRHCPKAIDALKPFYDREEDKLLIRSREIDARDLDDARQAIVNCMTSLVNQAEQEDRGLSDDEQVAFDALKDWAERFEQVYQREKPSNLPFGVTYDYEKDELGNPMKPKGSRAAGPLPKGEPLTQEQRMADWCRQHAPGPDIGQITVGDYLRAWLTGEHTVETQRAMTTTGTGGVLIPVPLSSQIIDLARNKSRVMQAGAVTWPMDASTLTVPRQTGDPEAKWRPELGHIHRTDLSFEPVILRACSLGALITVSMELMQDAIGLDAFLTRTLSQVMAEGIDQAALTGAGSKDSDSGERIEPVGVIHTDNIQTIDVSADLASYAPFSQAITKVREVNGEPNALMIAPTNLGILDALTDANGQPLLPPPSWSQVSHLDTNQLDSATAIVGDWTNLAIGLRSTIMIDYAQSGTIPEQGIREEVNLFSQAAVALRILWRGDVAVQRPDQFVMIKNIGVTPEGTATGKTRKRAA